MPLALSLALRFPPYVDSINIWGKLQFPLMQEKKVTALERRLILGNILVATSLSLTMIALSGCAGPLWEPPSPGSVIAESFSPDSRLLARITTTEIKGTYTLEVYDIRTGYFLSKRTISAPVGYHTHLVSLVWSGESRTVKATIDHDFGEGKRVTELHFDQIAVLNEKNR